MEAGVPQSPLALGSEIDIELPSSNGALFHVLIEITPGFLLHLHWSKSTAFLLMFL